MKKNFTKNKNRGFTLVETLVAIFIFVLSTTALVAVTGNSVSDVSIAKNKLVARALSEEGIEMVRNIRDSSALSGTGSSGWGDFADLMATCFGATGCKIDNPQEFFANNLLPVASACPGAGCALLTRDDSNLGYFEYGGGSAEATAFRRTIRLEYIGATEPSNEIKVTSTVSWKQGSVDKSITAVEHLFNWITN